MNLFKKIILTGGMVATLGLSVSTAAFASTGGITPNIPSGTHCGQPDPVKTPSLVKPGGNQGNQNGNQGNCGNQGNPGDPKGNPCNTKGNGLDSIFRQNSQPDGYTLFSDTQNNCKPVVPVSKPCSWDRIPVTGWVWQQTGKSGRYVRCTRDENWNNCTPRPVTPPCPCKTQNITFQLPTYGTWLLDVGGPALHNGETISYDGTDWTVGDWTTGANGSQGHGTYFTLKNGSTAVKGLGTRKNPGQELYEHATTICTTLHPVRSFA